MKTKQEVEEMLKRKDFEIDLCTTKIINARSANEAIEARDLRRQLMAQYNILMEVLND